MAILENRVKTPSNIGEFTKVVLIGGRRGLTIILMMLSLYLLYFSIPKTFSNFFLEATGPVISASFRLYDGVARQVSFVREKFVYLRDLENENIELKLEISRLKQLQSDIQSIQAENFVLRDLLNVAPEPHCEYTTAKLLSISMSPFGKVAIIGAGETNNIKVDQVVLGNGGLIGRIVEVSDHYAKVMLVTDLNSRIPVITGSSRERGILVGDGLKARIIYLAESHDVKMGEAILTSGDGKIHPAGIPVAEVTGISQNYVTVKPVSSLRKTDFVTVITGNTNLKSE